MPSVDVPWVSSGYSGATGNPFMEWLEQRALLPLCIQTAPSSPGRGPWELPGAAGPPQGVGLRSVLPSSAQHAFVAHWFPDILFRDVAVEPFAH